MPADDLPPPPRPPSRGAGKARRQARRRSLSPEAIADAALAIVDRDGLDALTMRAVAEALDTGPASLYAHVGSKDELLEMLVERVIGEVDFPAAPDPDRWEEQLKAIARDMRRMWAEHRDLARASFARIPLGPNALRASEAMVAVMRAGGLSDRVVSLGTDLLALYIGAVAFEESLQASEDWTPDRVAEFVAELRDFFAALPADRFPNLVALSGSLTEGDGEERFEFGLEVLIRGLAAVSAVEPRRPDTV
jgi:AcrR family transcriptional regulator